MDTFEYKPIHHVQYAFRLVLLRAGTQFDLDINCELIDAVLDDEDVIPYEALSYTWGTESPLREICLDGRRMSVRAGLHSALEQLRLPDRDRVLWIDAICINQDNDAEKMHQVQQMREIYEKAEQVIIWLGGLTYTSSTFLRCLKEFETRLGSTQLTKPVESEWLHTWKSAQEHVFSEMRTVYHMDFTHQLEIGVRSILAHPWFRRGWIIQEVANAQRATVQCDSVCFSSKIFGLMPMLAKSGELLIDNTSSTHLHSIFELMGGPRRRPQWWSGDRTLYTLVHKFSFAETSISRDRVYALLGMRSDIALEANNSKVEVVPDYEAAETSVIRWTIAEMYDCPLDIVPEAIVSSVAELCSSLAIVEHAIVCKLLRSAETQCVERLLKRPGSVALVTKDMLSIAIANSACGLQMLELLIRYRNCLIVWDEATLSDLFVHQPNAHVILEPKMFKHPGVRWSVMLTACLRYQSVTAVHHVLGCAHAHTQAALQVCISRYERDGCVMLPSKLGSHTREEMLCAAATNERHGESLVKLLLSHKSNYRWISERVVKTTANNSTSGPRILRTLLMSSVPLGEDHSLNPAALHIAALDPVAGPAMISKLLQACSNDFKSDPGTIRCVLQAANGNRILGPEVKTEIMKCYPDLNPLQGAVLVGKFIQPARRVVSTMTNTQGVQDLKTLRKRSYEDVIDEVDTTTVPTGKRPR